MHKRPCLNSKIYNETALTHMHWDLVALVKHATYGLPNRIDPPPPLIFLVKAERFAC